MDQNPEGNSIAVIKHDIKNQLSNITLCLEQLRFEVPEESDDCQYYLETISSSAKRINELLENI